MRYFMTFVYDGSNFLGYQKQPKGRTVQKEIESVLKQHGEEQEDIQLQYHLENILFHIVIVILIL